jgi:hypothetical protein
VKNIFASEITAMALKPEIDLSFEISDLKSKAPASFKNRSRCQTVDPLLLV